MPPRVPCAGTRQRRRGKAPRHALERSGSPSSWANARAPAAHSIRHFRAAPAQRARPPVPCFAKPRARRPVQTCPHCWHAPRSWPDSRASHAADTGSLFTRTSFSMTLRKSSAASAMAAACRLGARRANVCTCRLCPWQSNATSCTTSGPRPSVLPSSLLLPPRYNPGSTSLPGAVVWVGVGEGRRFVPRRGLSGREGSAAQSTVVSLLAPLCFPAAKAPRAHCARTPRRSQPAPQAPHLRKLLLPGARRSLAPLNCWPSVESRM